MKNFRLFFLLVSTFLAYVNPTVSQSIASTSKGKVKLTGQIVNDETLVPLEFATLSLYSRVDSMLVDGTVSDLDGKFELAVAPGLYYIVIDFLSYQQKIIPEVNIPVNKKSLDLGKIEMSESSKMLEEVEVIAEKSQMQLKLDKRVFNVGKDLSNTGANAAELLDNVPSVTVDVEGNVSLRGSQNVRILIDGKPSGLVGISSADALRQLQGDIVQSVEVITNPSARYDAEGEVGIINIVLKKEKREGVNGSFSLNAGYPENFGASYSLNMRKKKFNLFSNFGVNYRNGPGSGTRRQESINSAGELEIYESDRSHERGGVSGNFQLGTDWFVNKQNTISASLLFKRGLEDNVATINYRDFSSDNELLESSSRLNEEEETENNFEISLGHVKTFDKKDHKWSTDFKFISSTEIELADYTQTGDNLENPILQRSDNDETDANIFFQSDYSLPIGENSKFEAGTRITLRTIENDYMVEEQQDNGDWLVFSELDDELRYTENIYAAYLIFGSQIKNFSYQFGMRMEHSDIETELVQSGAANPRQYTDWFPSAHFSYEFSTKDQVQLSYSRRLSRPRFRSLLPFFSYTDNRSNYTGNPDLNPEYTNSIELGYLKYFEKGSILSSVYYRYRTGVISRVTDLLEDGITTARFPINLAFQNAYGIEFSGNYEITKWWDVNGNFNFYRAITEGSFKDQEIFADTYTWSTRWNTQIKFTKTLDFQVTFDYRAPRIVPQGETKAMYSINLGASKQVFKGKGTLTLSVRDLLNSRRWQSITRTDNLLLESEFQWRARQLLLSFNYRLGKNKGRKGKGRRGGNRGGGGGGDMDF